MLKLYSAPRTRSIRVAWLFEEMGLEYELINGEFVRTGSAFYVQDTPTGKFPTIDDDGFVMFESGAIIEYVLARYGDGSLQPAVGSADYGEYLQWLHFADATAFSPLGILAWLTLYRDDADQHEGLIADAKKRAATGFEYLARQMADRTWILGDQFTAADVMLGFTLLSARSFGVIPDESPLTDYLSRLQARPAFVRAAVKTGNT